MKKSIETIWKEGFLRNEELLVPKINNLYDQKSISTVDKLMKMGKTNLVAITIGALFFLLGFSFIGAPISGIILFALLMWLVVYGKIQASKIEKVDKSLDSYHYIKTVDNWLKLSISGYIKIYRFFYPAFILACYLGIWYSGFGQKVSHKLISAYPDVHLIYNIPMPIAVGIAVIAGLMSLFAGTIYRLDLNLVYGHVFKKLEEIINDMEQLKG